MKVRLEVTGKMADFFDGIHLRRAYQESHAYPAV
jgi:hypothetical protein